MARFKFTAAALTRFFEENPTSNGCIWDSETRGLGAYRASRGVCTLFVQYRLANGQQKKKALGRLAEVTIGQARALAMDYALAGRHGRDLVAERKAVDEPKTTLGDAYLAYTTALKRRGASENTMRLNARNWSAYVSRHQSRDIASISRADVRSWHADWGKHGPTVANQTARLVRAVFNYALNKLTTSATENPCRAIEYFKERNLRRIIAAEALAEWWKAVDGIENPIRRGYWQVLLLTGLRKEDAATIKWADVNSTHIHRPNPKGGATRAFDLPITQPLAKILTEMREAGSRMFPGSEYVFPAASAKGHIICPREEKHIPKCSPHDLRRTYATLCIQAGVDPYTTKMLLNHAPDTSDVTARYIIPSADACRTAAERVAQHILALVTPSKEDTECKSAPLNTHELPADPKPCSGA